MHTAIQSESLPAATTAAVSPENNPESIFYKAPGARKKVPVAPQAPFWLEIAMVARDTSIDLVTAACDLDIEDTDASSDAIRVLRAAVDLIGNLVSPGALKSDMPDVQVASVAYDFLATLTAALHYPGQPLLPARLQLIDKAQLIVGELANVLSNGSEGQSFVAALESAIQALIRPVACFEPKSAAKVDAPLVGYTAQQRETVLFEIASKAGTLGDFLRETRELSFNAARGSDMYNSIDVAATMADMLGLLADAAVGGLSKGDVGAWIIGPNFANEGKAVAA